MAADEPIPVFKTVQDAHPVPAIAAREAVRYAQLAEHYTSLFGHPPTHIARAPGRVNIIGEHIDYALFGVFPTAVEQDVLIACGPQPDTQTPHGKVKARNLEPKYTPQEFVPTLISDTTVSVTSTEDDRIHIGEDPAASRGVQWHLDIDPSQLRWESYVKAGYYGVLDRFFNHPHTVPKPVDILVTGSVPAGSGLSSSAAMVVASTLAFLAVNDKLALTKGELVQMAVENEKRVGVNSGGMDQAASVTSLPTSALYISFFPHFSVDPVPLPFSSPSTAPNATHPGAVFVVANSLVVSDKLVGAKSRYNLRVVETLVAARVLARALGLSALLELDPSDSDYVKKRRFTLRHVLGAWVGVSEAEGEGKEVLSPEKIKEGLEGLVREVGRLKAGVLRGEKEFVRPTLAEAERVDGPEDEDEGVTMEEMVQFSGLSKEEFHEVYLSWVEVEATHFQLYKRTKHVLTEALRVLQFRSLCLSSSSSPSSTTQEPQPSDQDPEHLLKALGTLLTTSHTSCRTLYDCSHPSLDALTALARSLPGAYGSRLTGAGWGGASISLVRADCVERFVQGLREGYEPFGELGEEAFRGAVFVSGCGSGAFVYEV